MTTNLFKTIELYDKQLLELDLLFNEKLKQLKHINHDMLLITKQKIKIEELRGGLVPF